MLCRDRHGAVKVREVRAPAAAQLDVLAVDLPVRVDADIAVVRVVAADHDPSPIAHEIERLGHRLGSPRCLDHDVDAEPAGDVTDRLQPVGRVDRQA